MNIYSFEFNLIFERYKKWSSSIIILFCILFMSATTHAAESSTIIQDSIIIDILPSEKKPDVNAVTTTVKEEMRKTLLQPYLDSRFLKLGGAPPTSEIEQYVKDAWLLDEVLEVTETEHSTLEIVVEYSIEREPILDIIDKAFITRSRLQPYKVKVNRNIDNTLSQSVFAQTILDLIDTELKSLDVLVVNGGEYHGIIDITLSHSTREESTFGVKLQIDDITTTMDFNDLKSKINENFSHTTSGPLVVRSKDAANKSWENASQFSDNVKRRLMKLKEEVRIYNSQISILLNAGKEESENFRRWFGQQSVGVVSFDNVTSKVGEDKYQFNVVYRGKQNELIKEFEYRAMDKSGPRYQIKRQNSEIVSIQLQ